MSGKKGAKDTGARRKKMSRGQSGKKQAGRTAGKKKPETESEPALTPGRKRVIYGVTFLVLSIFTFLCMFAPSTAGIVGRGVKTAFAWTVGLGRFAIPFLFLGAAVLMFVKGPQGRSALVAIGVSIMCLSVLALLQVSASSDIVFNASELYGGGGFLGAVIAWPLSRLVGKVGAYVFLVAALVVGVVVAFEEQLKVLWESLKAGRARSPVASVEQVPAGESGTKSNSRRNKQHPGTPKVYPSDPSPALSIEEESDGQLAISVKKQGSGKYRIPPVSILNQAQNKAFSKQSNEERKKAIEKTLKSMDVNAKVVKVSKGPTVSLFEVEVGTGEKVKRVTELEQDIAYALGSPDIRIYSPIPGRQAIGIEVPNNIRDTVLLGDIIGALGPVASHNRLTMSVGKDMSGKPVVLDLSQLPHMLLAGSTGAGKSCCINSLVCCLLFRNTPDELKLIMIDPKFVEFTYYEGLPHLLCEVINEPEPASRALTWAVEEMEKRYQMLQKARVVHIDDYNAIAQKDDGFERMPKIVIVIDELGDLMIVARREVESSISRLTAKARAVGIHMIIATQRPSVDVITGVIKNNITARIAFQVASNADSRTILGTKGAEKLLGKGDMLLDPGNIPQPERVQGALIQRSEIELLTGFIREQKVKVKDSIDLETMESSAKGRLEEQDPLLMEAAEFVVFAGEASASMLQTHLRVGYARARRIVIELAKLGIVGPHEGSKSRKVLLTPEEFEEWKSSRVMS